MFFFFDYQQQKKWQIIIFFDVHILHIKLFNDLDKINVKIKYIDKYNSEILSIPDIWRSIHLQRWDFSHPSFKVMSKSYRTNDVWSLKLQIYFNSLYCTLDPSFHYIIFACTQIYMKKFNQNKQKMFITGFKVQLQGLHSILWSNTV